MPRFDRIIYEGYFLVIYNIDNFPTGGGGLGGPVNDIEINKGGLTNKIKY